MMLGARVETYNLTFWAMDGKKPDKKKMYPAHFLINGWLQPVVGHKPVDARMKIVLVATKDRTAYNLGIISALVDIDAVDIIMFDSCPSATSTEQKYRAPESKTPARVRRDDILLATESSFRTMPVQLELKKETIDCIKALLTRPPIPDLIRNDEVIDEDLAEQINDHLTELLPDVNPSLLEVRLTDRLVHVLQS